MIQKDTELLSRLEALADLLPDNRSKAELYACANALLDSGLEIAGEGPTEVVPRELAPLAHRTFTPDAPDRRALRVRLRERHQAYARQVG